MRSFIYSLFLFFLLLLLHRPIYATDITNNSFETETEGWTKTTNAVLFSITTTESKEASKSAEITYTSTTSNGIKQPIVSVTPDKTYTISAFIKATSAKKAFIRIAWYQAGSTSQIKTDDSIIVGPASDWTLSEFTVTSPLNASSAEVRLLVSEGTAYFDSIRMEEYYPAAPTPTPTVPITTAPLMTITPSATPTSMPTPTANATPSSIINYNNIIISEAFVYPDAGMNEWIELYNNNSFTVNLTNWYIDDAADSGSLPKQINATIPAYGFTVIDISTALFNNTGDMVRLLDTNKLVKDSFEYDASQKNKSIGRTILSSNAVCIQNPTKGAANEPCIQIDADEEEAPSPTPAARQQLLITPHLSPTTKSVRYAYTKPAHLISTLSPARSSKTNADVTIIDLPKKNESAVHKKPKIATFLAASYSLLSFISVGVKMIIARH